MLQESIQQLLILLNRWDRRLRFQQSVLWIPRSLSAGLILAVGVALVARLRPFLMPEQVLIVGGAAVIVGLLVMLGVIWLRQPEALAAARRFDRLFGLKERISTALELAAGGIRSPNEEITSRLVDDTLKRAGQINAAAYLPLRVLRRDVLLTLALAAVLALLVLLPNPQNNALAEQQEFDSVLQQQVDALESLREQIAQNPDMDEAMQREMMDALDETIEQLTREDMSQEEAFATLSDLAEQMQQIAEEMPEESQQDAMREALEQALQQAAETLQESDSEQAAEAGESLAQGDMQAAQDALQGLADSLGEMSQAEQQALSEALQAAADQIAETSPEMAEALEEAAEALEQGDTQAAQEALEEASEQMAEQGQQDATGSQAQAQTRQMASQAAQQAEQSAQQMAQTRSQQQGENGQQGEQQPGGESGEGNTATRIEQAPAGQEGQPTQGDGENPAQQAGEGQSAGQQTGAQQPAGQEAGSSAGAGDGEGGQQEGGFEASGEQISQENAPSGQGLTEYEPVFAPQSIGEGEGQQLQVTGSGEPGDVIAQEGEFMESPEGEAIVGYDQVFSDYANAANQAMERDYIPLTLRDVIHDYFASLEP